MTKSIGNFNYLHSAASHLKVFKSNRKGDFSLLQWSEVLSRWLAKDICLYCDSCVKIASIFFTALFTPLLLFLPLLLPSIHSSIYAAYLPRAMRRDREYARCLNACCLVWSSHEERRKAADCNTLFIFINHRRRRFSEDLGKSGVCCNSWIKPGFFQLESRTHRYAFALIQCASGLCQSLQA